MATAPIYCTHKELKRVFPQLDSFDGKKQVYGWTSGLSNWYDSDLDLHYVGNSGLVTQLYWDGNEIDNISYNTTETTKLNGALTASATTFDVDSGTSFGANDIIKVNNEYMRVVSVSTNEITVSTPATNRGILGTNAQHHENDASVYLIIDASADIGDSTQASPVALSFVYDTDLDLCILVTKGDPNDYLIEAGEDFTTLITQYRTDASRYLDSMLDPNMPKEAFKDKSGNFDYLIIRTTALIAANFMIKSHDPNSELANALMEEATLNIENINQGKAALSFQVTRDSSNGIVRDVSYTDGSIRPVDTRGEWTGTYDLIQVKITTGGRIGTATYSVWTKDANKLKNNQVVTNKIINGDYQPLAGGLEIRFAGDDMNPDSGTVATDTNEWEIEVFGRYEEVDASSGKAVKMTRTKKYGRVY
tara:strand:+ start:1839 stop:3098 length:1260 start_codon:yes stop_codon:yes gene_type:complete